MGEPNDAYKFVGSFTAFAGKAILAGWEKEKVRFEVDLDQGPTGLLTGAKYRDRERVLTSAVKLYVHGDDRAKAEAIMVALGYRPSVDFIAQTGEAN